MRRREVDRECEHMKTYRHASELCKAAFARHLRGDREPTFVPGVWLWFWRGWYKTGV